MDLFITTRNLHILLRSGIKSKDNGGFLYFAKELVAIL